MRLSVVNASTAVAVPATTDWIALSKTVSIEVVFIAASVSAIFFHGGADAKELAFATGAALGVLRLGDTVANLFNVRAVVNSPVAQRAGILPQAAGTPLTAVTTNGDSKNAGTPTA